MSVAMCTRCVCSVLNYVSEIIANMFLVLSLNASVFKQFIR